MKGVKGDKGARRGAQVRVERMRVKGTRRPDFGISSPLLGKGRGLGMGMSSLLLLCVHCCLSWGFI